MWNNYQHREMTEHEIALTRSIIHKKLDELTEEELLFHLQNCDGWIAAKKSKRIIYGLSKWESEMLENIINHRLKVLDRLPTR